MICPQYIFYNANNLSYQLSLCFATNFEIMIYAYHKLRINAELSEQFSFYWNFLARVDNSQKNVHK